ncbi:MAG: hypothetical protein JWO10_272 [Microbacteriaceae bacterium]|nr:hypothetical protein [Microbacteriaceae bacterium]
MTDAPYGTPRFAMPGTWARVSLTSDASVQSSIRKLVERAVGRDDRNASLRQELRSRFREAADVARENDAVDFHVALEIAPGVPMPAWLAVFLPKFDSAEFAAFGSTELGKALDFGLAGVQTENPASRSVLDGDRMSDKIKAVRQAFRRVRAATDDEPELQLLQADYWLTATHPNRIALMTFTTNFVDLEEQMLDLFDAVISTVRWPVPATVPA